MKFLGEKKRSPEREKERMTSSPRTSSASFAYESDSSDNEENYAIKLQEYKVELEKGKLARMKARYAKRRSERK